MDSGELSFETGCAREDMSELAKALACADWFKANHCARRLRAWSQNQSKSSDCFKRVCKRSVEDAVDLLWNDLEPDADLDALDEKTRLVAYEKRLSDAADKMFALAFVAMRLCEESFAGRSMGEGIKEAVIGFASRLVGAADYLASQNDEIGCVQRNSGQAALIGFIVLGASLGKKGHQLDRSELMSAADGFGDFVKNYDNKSADSNVSSLSVMGKELIQAWQLFDSIFYDKSAPRFCDAGFYQRDERSSIA